MLSQCLHTYFNVNASLRMYTSMFNDSPPSHFGSYRTAFGSVTSGLICSKLTSFCRNLFSTMHALFGES